MGIRKGFGGAFGLLFVLASAGHVLGCGGGGGGDGTSDPNAAWSGDYAYLVVGRPDAGGVFSEIGPASADGAGHLGFGTAVRAYEGGAATNVIRVDHTYAIAGDRSLSISGAGGAAYTGRIGAGGSVGAATARQAGSDPELFMFTRRNTSATVASVAGAWRMLQWQRVSGSADSTLSSMARVTISSSGEFVVSGYFFNQDGEINPYLIMFVAADVVADPGGRLRLVVSGSGTTAMVGYVSDDGNLIFFGSASSAGAYASARVLVREGLVTSDSGIGATYDIETFEQAGTHYDCAWGGLTFNGAGAGSGSVDGNQEGTLIGPFPFDVTYEVSITGSASVIETGGTSWVGGIGPGGSYLVMSGGWTPGASRTILFLVR